MAFSRRFKSRRRATPEMGDALLGGRRKRRSRTSRRGGSRRRMLSRARRVGGSRRRSFSRARTFRRRR